MSGRFTRQIRLAEVGEAGQARLAAARVQLGATGPAREIEERYLRAAGVGVTDADPAHMVAAPRGGTTGTRTPTLTGLRAVAESPDLGIRHASARAVADGAFAALLAMRTALGVGA